MADVPVVDENDDNWLYGDSNPDAPANGSENLANGDATPAETEEAQDKQVDEPAPEEEKIDETHLNDEHFEEGDQPEEDQNEDGQENGDSDSDDSEDDVKVIVGDIVSTPQAYSNLNIKRGGLIVQPNLDKQKQTGKFSAEEFDSVGTINGVPAQEFNIDVLEDKPWRKPGADLTDYFNYGFNEDTWRAYCERQKRMRVQESKVGLVPLGGPAGGLATQLRHLTPILNDNSKYTAAAIPTIRKTGPPQGIGRTSDEMGSEPPPPVSPMQIPVRENVIQVMTADRREYSRTKAFPDMSLPPPGVSDFFHGPPDPYYMPPFPQEDWGPEAGWAPGDIKELTPGPGPMGLGPPPGMGPPPLMMGRPPPPQHYMERREQREEMREKEDRESVDTRDRDRDRERDRSRSIKPDRHREKSHRRERSRSRSRRHKSRSRSPSSRHRSKKKSSHRKDKEDSE